MQDHQVVLARPGSDVVEASPAGGASTSLLPGTRAAGWASQVGIPVRADLPLRLVPGARPAVEALKGRRIQE